MNCQYCLDTKFVDRSGNPKGENIGKLIPCPLCNKVEPVKLDIDVDKVLENASRKNIAWTVEFTPKWSENAVKEIAVRLDRMILNTKGYSPATLGKPTKEKEQRLEFHASFPYEFINEAFYHLGIPKNEYKIVLDKMEDNNAY